MIIFAVNRYFGAHMCVCVCVHTFVSVFMYASAYYRSSGLYICTLLVCSSKQKALCYEKDKDERALMYTALITNITYN